MQFIPMIFGKMWQICEQNYIIYVKMYSVNIQAHCVTCCGLTCLVAWSRPQVAGTWPA